MKLIEELTPLNLIFLSLAIIGIFLSIFFYSKSKKEKSPVYNIKSNQLIKNNLSSIEKLQIIYDGELLENLNLTKVSFWNAGRETINKSDVIEFDPLRIISKNENLIYDCKIDFVDKRNNISIDIENKTIIKIVFDYLDRNQGVLLSVFHSGTFSDIEIKGSFKGAENLKLGYGREPILRYVFNSKPLKFSENLINSENKLISILALFISLPIIIFLGLIITPFDYLEKIYNSPPKEFRLK